MPDNAAKPRRWFQFRLTTWLVLVAILAWTMFLGPYCLIVFRHGPHGHDDFMLQFGEPEQRAGGWALSGRSARGHSSTDRELTVAFGPNPELEYPALALAAFSIGKAAWLIAKRTRAKSLVPLS